MAAPTREDPAPLSLQDLSIIQGGMGVGVSSWQLARTVSQHGHLGVVSGVALDVVLARRLQDGDPEGIFREALATFPDQEMVARLLSTYFRPDGRAAGEPYRPAPRLALRAASLPLDSIVLETDAPDMPPAWLAGGRNTPSELPGINAVLAELRGVGADELASATSTNALAVLPRLLSVD